MSPHQIDVNVFNIVGKGKMILDGHIHLMDSVENREELLQKLEEAGVNGGIVISLPPQAFRDVGQSAPPMDRMSNVLNWCELSKTLYPFFWIDPLEDGAADQVDMAVDKGVMGFKVICDRYYPGDGRAMKIFEAIAKTDRPLLFHSGILWDGKPSSMYNRPSEFEALLEIKGLRFCLAHISWPWCDELIAVYGKFLNAYTRNSNLSVEMFIDIAPGTPPVYRKEALTKLFTVGYDVQNNVIFGSDSCANRYNVEWTQQWLSLDREIFQDLGLEEEMLGKIYAENLRRFLGVSPLRIDRKLPKPGE